MKIDFQPLKAYVWPEDFGKFERDLIRLIIKYQKRYEKEKNLQTSQRQANT